MICIIVAPIPKNNLISKIRILFSGIRCLYRHFCKYYKKKKRNLMDCPQNMEMEIY